MPVDPGRSLMPSWLPAVNRRVTNRVQGLWAPYVPPYATIVHTGRRSGRSFRTPVLASVRGRTMFIPLPYSARAQWVRNLLAAGGGEAIRRGRRYRLHSPRVIVEAHAEPLTPVARRLVRRMAVLAVELERPA